MHGQTRESFDDSAVARAASLIEQADALIVAAGAGMDVGLRLGTLAGLAVIAQVLGSELGSLNGEDDDGLR